MQKIEDTIAALTKRGEQLAVKRAKAQDLLDKATKARQDALLSGDLDDQRAIDKLQIAVDSAASALVGIDDAIGILAQQKSEAETALAEERERVARAAAADKLTAQVAAIETAFKPWLEQSRIFADTLAELAHMHFGADEMSKFLENCMGQLETAMNFQVTELKTMPAGLLDGRLPVPADKPKPAPVEVTKPAPETHRLFALRPLKWTDAEGHVRYGQQFEDCDLPPVAARRALRLGAVCNLHDQRRNEVRGSRGGQHVNTNAVDLLDLDDEEDCRPQHIQPVMRSDPLSSANFTVIDRSSEAREIAIAVPRI
jgi:hypothetical protein